MPKNNTAKPTIIPSLRKKTPLAIHNSMKNASNLLVAGVGCMNPKVKHIGNAQQFMTEELHLNHHRQQVESTAT